MHTCARVHARAGARLHWLKYSNASNPAPVDYCSSEDPPPPPPLFLPSTVIACQTVLESVWQYSTLNLLRSPPPPLPVYEHMHVSMYLCILLTYMYVYIRYVQHAPCLLPLPSQHTAAHVLSLSLSWDTGRAETKKIIWLECEVWNVSM